MHELGGLENVAEITGRKRVVGNDGTIQYVTGSGVNTPTEIIDINEKEMFMDGKKKIAIISEAASSRISLHADNTRDNKAKRVYIIISLPWSVEKKLFKSFIEVISTMKQIPPEYIFVILNLASEQ